MCGRVGRICGTRVCRIQVGGSGGMEGSTGVVVRSGAAAGSVGTTTFVFSKETIIRPSASHAGTPGPHTDDAHLPGSLLSTSPLYPRKVGTV